MTRAAHYTRRDKGLTRKEMLKLGLLGSAALFLPLERAARTKSLADRIRFEPAAEALHGALRRPARPEAA